MPNVKKYQFWAALRVFSLAVALISCTLGIRLAWDSATPQYLLAILILLGGLLAQAGMNLINDIEDLNQSSQIQISESDKNHIIRNYRLGWLAFGLAALVSLVLIYLRGWSLLLVIVVSALLALNYNSGPLNFKHRGLAALQVFILMGLVMIHASYYVMSGQFNLQVLWVSIPVSLLISLLLLSNEIRDYQYDKAHGVQTLSVQIGLESARRLYWGLIIAAYVAAVAVWYWIIPLKLWLLLIPIPMLPVLARHLQADDRQQLTPLSGRFFLLFGLAYLVSI